MTRCIHSVMQDTHDCDAISRGAKVDHVPLNASAAIARPDVIAGGCCPGCLRQVGKDRNQPVDITIGLLPAPLLAGVNPDAFKVALGGGSEAVLSHSRRAFSA